MSHRPSVAARGAFAALLASLVLVGAGCGAQPAAPVSTVPPAPKAPALPPGQTAPPPTSQPSTETPPAPMPAEPPGQKAPEPPKGSAAETTALVEIASMAFQPATVTISAGSTVIWTNHDPVAHTVTADDGSFDSGSVPTNGTFSHVFAKAGTFEYHCTVHPSMKGTIVVH